MSVFVQVLFNPDKQNVVAYNEKFQRWKFSPTVSLFGNKPMAGWMAVTSSGMVTFRSRVWLNLVWWLVRYTEMFRG